MDLEEERRVSTKEAEELAESLKIPYMETSAKNGNNVDEVFMEFVKKCIEAKIRPPRKIGCFPNGSLVTLEDDSTLPIEKIKKGMQVASFDLKNKKIVKSRVDEVIQVERDDWMEIICLTKYGNINIISSIEHPYFVTNKNNWCSMDPKCSMREYGIKCDYLEIGDDFLFTKNGNIEKATVKHIIYKKGNMQMFTLKCDKFHSFFVNGILVHNKCRIL